MRALKGEVAQSEGAPGVTHVVYPYGPKGDPDDGQEYLRTLEVGGVWGVWESTLGCCCGRVVG